MNITSFDEGCSTLTNRRGHAESVFLLKIEEKGEAGRGKEQRARVAAEASHIFFLIYIIWCNGELAVLHRTRAHNGHISASDR